MQALRTATTGMAAQQLNVEVISNNIANMNTVGYKRRRAEFQDLLYETLQRAGAQSSDQGTVVPTGLQIGTGVKAGSIYRITEQGSMTQTGNKLDVAVQGRGYLQVLMPTGEIAYTRAGNLSLNDQGQVVTADGYQIQPAIVIPPDAVDISISKSGQVQVQQAGQTAPSIVGNLELATFVNEGGLEAIGDNLYLESGASGAPTLSVPGVDGAGTLLQGFTEASNVDAVGEITALIVAQRAYEMNSKVITSADEMLSTANQVKS
ncbi:flagellar basal-body rod protein FlgG [Phenylobacterium sp.]|jgi:flagellar basal-body rod protein FlgG|uniref:flagellar basal-body rod protein FlgG n=1 Tax=Phenylobacterium sp. TaxID=1871053 RepID=UPI0025D64E13|nr:flagellar basal-body rod protein FlgG [Phenylobacterium sp.]MCA6310321.1 flagellar basal-body rod protein FlgG [Phenylobacterium sp.]MCA6324674.1 flagellar basal-body rod protein FlgG [Phenylobacterium sp.]MCA6336638.1 flagellar basal-body rod protein FlgG [Phenylobacterium sp.]MCA6340652.1 flagellar basal-body rod protein FlgG [Phenylobacterium sp.]MCA6341810.1 flagellar basal-body rod protein FlgG [Phenylobacterium sp.]